jgi:hypothetical protein
MKWLTGISRLNFIWKRGFEHMEIYLVQYENGMEHEYQEVEEVGIFDTFEKAYEFVTSCGFVAAKNDINYFSRQHQNVEGECIAHKDYAYITRFKLNTPKEHIEYFTRHYTN